MESENPYIAKLISLGFILVLGAMIVLLWSSMRASYLVKKIPQKEVSRGKVTRDWLETPSTFKVKKTDTEIEFTWVPADLSNLQTIDHFEVGADQILDFGDGERAMLEAIQVGYSGGPLESEFASQTFNPVSLEPMQRPETKGEKYYLEFEKAPSKPILFPRFTVHFGEKRFEEGPGLTDLAGNSFPGSSSGRTASRGSYAVANYYIPWYSQPIFIEAEFAYGKPKEVTVPFEVGQGGEFEHLSFSIIGIHEFDHPDGGSRSDSGKRVTTIRNSEKGKTILMTVHFDKIRELPTEIEIIPINKSENKPTPTCFYDRIDQFAFLKILDTRVSSIKQLQFRKRRQAVGIFKLDKIPGLPRENYDLTNALDARIPYVSINKGDGDNFLARAAGLEWQQSDALESVTTSSYPLIYRNHSLKEIALDFQKKAELYRLDVIDDKFLRVRPGPGHIWEKQKEKLSNWWNP